MPQRFILVFPLIVFLLSSCFVARLDEGENGEPRIPEAPPDTIGGPPTGPVHILATGLTEELGWRYSVYPSAEGPCLQFEYDSGDGGGGSAGCGMLEEFPDEPFSGVGAGSSPPDVGHIVGWVRSDVHEVWLRTVDGRTLDAELFDVDEAGLQAQAFLVLVPPGVHPSMLVAWDEDGDELGTADVSHALGPPPRDQLPAQPPETTRSASRSRPGVWRDAR